MINNIDLTKKSIEFQNSLPFNHIVIDDFFEEHWADKLAEDFPQHNSKFWRTEYNNPLEIKKTNQYWGDFSSIYYSTFMELLTNNFISTLKDITKIKNLYIDPGLYGGGLHSHSAEGKLNVHLDYSRHSKLPLQRKLNLIVYLNKGWQDSWGGHLELWSHDDTVNKPKECIKKILPKFNRAVLFDTTQNSWHGLPEKLKCPDNVARKSIAIYYLTDLTKDTNPRSRAYYAPYKDQENDKEILLLIEKRSNNNTANTVYTIQ
jgi:Rps23 Pro-64 3,4-dihydroxylase Tpa1-like proline 4-hydroxylase